jgi:hypothetical protein
MEIVFAVGTFWFWALVVAEIALLLAFTEYESGIGATVAIAIFVAALQWMGDVDIINHIKTHPWHLLVLAGSYLLFGICWLAFKWVRFVKEKLNLYDEFLERFCVSKGLPEDTKSIPPEHRRDWVNRVNDTRDYYTKQTIADTPKIKNHKSKAMIWMSLWVFSMVMFFLKDMVRETFNLIYVKIAGSLQRLADKIWSRPDIKENFIVPEEQDTNRR